MSLPERQGVRLRASTNRLTAWVGERYLGLADVHGDKVIITVDIKQAVEGVPDCDNPGRYLETPQA